MLSTRGFSEFQTPCGVYFPFQDPRPKPPKLPLHLRPKSRQRCWRLASETPRCGGVCVAVVTGWVRLRRLPFILLDVVASSISLISALMDEKSLTPLLLLFPPNPLRWVSAGALILSSVSSRKATQIRSNRPGRYLFSLLPAKPHTAAHRGEHGLVFAVPLLPADAP